MDENNNVVVRVGDQEFIRGEDGYSPVVTIEEIEHGHSVNITDREHQAEGQTFNVLDGASAYEQAVAGGYEGTEAEFNADLAGFSEKAQTATSAAASAAQNAQNAAGSASTATTKAQEAADSAATALTRMNSANSSAQAAANSATSAGSSASAAAASASAANGSAANASASESNAANSATNAAASETAAAASESAAAASATAAGNAQTAAETAQGKAEDAQEAAETAQGAAETAAQSVSESAEQIATNTQDIDDLKDEVAELTDQIEDLNYKPVSIIAFSVSPNHAEIGSTVSSATLSWTINKKPTTLTLDGDALTPVASGTEAKTGLSVTANKTFALTATDSGSPSHAPASDSKIATLSFLSKVHYGLGSGSQEITDAFINGLTGVLAATRQRTVSFTPSGSQYIYFALPQIMCSGINFVVASGAGQGFALAVDRIETGMSHTNASGGVVAYNVYKSVNPISSALSVKIE